jgi:hypothetical protein
MSLPDWKTSPGGAERQRSEVRREAVRPANAFPEGVMKGSVLDIGN